MCFSLCLLRFGTILTCLPSDLQSVSIDGVVLSPVSGLNVGSLANSSCGTGSACKGASVGSRCSRCSRCSVPALVVPHLLVVLLRLSSLCLFWTVSISHRFAGSSGTRLLAGQSWDVPSNLSFLDNSTFDPTRPIALQLRFRTFVNDTILFSCVDVANSLDYVTVGLVAGQVFVSFDYSGTLALASVPLPAADGSWHQLALTRTAAQAIVALDGVAATAAADLSGDGWRGAYGLALDGRPATALAVFNGSVTLPWCAARCLDQAGCRAFSYRPTVVTASLTVMLPMCMLSGWTGQPLVFDLGVSTYALLTVLPPALRLGSASFAGCVDDLTVSNRPVAVPGEACAPNVG